LARANQVEKLLETQRTENQRLTEELEERKNRYINRELEYRKIIEDLQNEIRD
jgi:hypothetical protein